jgi:hypothetical protein
LIVVGTVAVIVHVVPDDGVTKKTFPVPLCGGLAITVITPWGSMVVTKLELQPPTCGVDACVRRDGDERAALLRADVRIRDEEIDFREAFEALDDLLNRSFEVAVARKIDVECRVRREIRTCGRLRRRAEGLIVARVGPKEGVLGRHDVRRRPDRSGRSPDVDVRHGAESACRRKPRLVRRVSGLQLARGERAASDHARVVGGRRGGDGLDPTSSLASTARSPLYSAP